jgi:hypothetical protein
LFPVEITRVLVVAAGNSNAVVDSLVEWSASDGKEKFQEFRSCRSYRIKIGIVP